MKNPKKEYCVKIYTGTHAGTELTLYNGQYRIGSSDDCDIILEDCNAQEQLVGITLENDGIIIQRENGPCYLEGKPLHDEPEVLEHFSIITLGTANLAIGPYNAKWPEFKRPEIIEDKASDETFVDTGAVNDLSVVPDQQLKEKVEGVVSGWRKLLYGVLVIIAIVLFTHISIDFNQKEDEKAIASEQVKQQLSNILDSLQVDKATILGNEHGALVVSGILQKRADEDKLLAHIGKLQYPVVARLHAVDEIKSLFKTVLDNYHLNLGVRYKGNGKFALHGFVRDKALVQQVVHRLQKDLPMVGQLDVRVQTHETLIPSIFEEIERLGGIKGRIEIQAHPDSIRASGDFLPGDRGIWREAKKEIEQRYGDHINFKENFTIKPVASKGNKNVAINTDPVTELRRLVAGLTFGPRPYIITANGQKVFEGAVLGDVFRVKRIMKDRIIAEKNGSPVTLTLP